jgi:hypothetical protein
MGKAWHVAVFIVGHGGRLHHSGSYGAPRLATAGTASPAALATLTFVGEGCCHHIRSLLLFYWILPFVVVPLSSILDGGSL